MARFIRPASGLLLIVSLLVLAACASGETAPTLTPTATPSPTIPLSLLATLDIVQARTAELRGLELLEEVDRSFLARDELEAFLVADLEEEDREDLLKVQQVMAILGLISQDTDLYQLFLDLYAEQILGLYDSETKQMYLIGEPDQFGPLAEVTLAHEYVHALQQQHFDIHALREAIEEDPEALDGLTALIEGDAYLHSFDYISAFLTPEEREQAFQGDDAGSSVFDAAPYAIQQFFLFPLEGLAFVADLVRRGGQGAINDAFHRPPVTTETSRDHRAGSAPGKVQARGGGDIRFLAGPGRGVGRRLGPGGRPGPGGAFPADVPGNRHLEAGSRSCRRGMGWRPIPAVGGS